VSSTWLGKYTRRPRILAIDPSPSAAGPKHQFWAQFPSPPSPIAYPCPSCGWCRQQCPHDRPTLARMNECEDSPFNPGQGLGQLSQKGTMPPPFHTRGAYPMPHLFWSCFHFFLYKHSWGWSFPDPTSNSKPTLWMSQMCQALLDSTSSRGCSDIRAPN
jgi:hypothetical protein